MIPLIVIREKKSQDDIVINELVRNSYLTNVSSTWAAAIFKEITFQLMVTTAAIMFIFLGFPLVYCVACVPIVLLVIYISIYSSYLMKAMEICSKRSVQTWVAEACEPHLFLEKPEDVTYRLVMDELLRREGVDIGSCRRKIIGTISVMKSYMDQDTIWCYKLAVDKSYRKKGVANALVKCSQNWSARNGFLNMETAVSECQDSARNVFVVRGFHMKQMYHKKIIGPVVSYLMYNLQFNLKSPQLQS